jgi:UDP-galactopyranose mutase
MTSADQESPVAATSPFRSFWMGGFEGADHVNSRGEALDMALATSHVQRLDDDYRQAAALGIATIRESIGWRLSEPRPGCFALERAQRCARSARKHGLQVIWTLMHYGIPEDLSLFDDRLIDRFAAFARAVAEAISPLSDDPPVYNLVNEINFTAWAAAETGLFGGAEPGRQAVESGPPASERSGYEVKCRLVRAVLAGIAAIREVDPRARFLHVEPIVHVVAPEGSPELEATAARVKGYQWQALDLIAGRAEPQLGGSPDALDLIGVNYYHSGQWEVGTERRLYWHEHDPRRRRLSDLLDEVWQRYRRPLILAETSHVGSGRAAWLNDTLSEVAHARRVGVPVEGVCLYPLIDRPDWDDPSHWHNSGLWDVVPESGQRVLDPAYAKALGRWQSAHSPLEKQRPDMQHLIVFSHLRWSFVYQRPQQLLSRLASHYHVIFIEEPVCGAGRARFERSSQGPNLDVLVPRTPVTAAGFHDDQMPVLQPLLSDYLRENGIDDYLVWFYTPMALPLLEELEPRAIVYDCMDELSAFKDAPTQLRERESALLARADLVFTGGPALYEAKRYRHHNVHCLPSAVDADHFSPACLIPDSAEAIEAERLQASIGRPRLGYFGVIDERLDLGLLTRLADERRDVHLVMAGPVVKIDPALLPRRPNIHWLGLQPYARLPYLVAQWDACLIPFAINESTRYTSPTKTLEYMAAEKPVISTAVHDVVALYGDLVRIAADVDQFIDACDEALIETGRERSRRLGETLKTVAWFSWDQSAETVRQAIEQLRRTPVPPVLVKTTTLLPPKKPRLSIAARPIVTRLPVPPIAVDAVSPARQIGALASRP